MKITVTEGEYVDRTLATASWYDRYQLVPGEYSAELTTIDDVPTTLDAPFHRRPYYVRAWVDAVKLESYRVNRLFSASSAHTEAMHTPTRVLVRVYAYQVRDGATVTVLNGCAVVSA